MTHGPAWPARSSGPADAVRTRSKDLSHASFPGEAWPRWVEAGAEVGILIRTWEQTGGSEAKHP